MGIGIFPSGQMQAAFSVLYPPVGSHRLANRMATQPGAQQGVWQGTPGLHLALVAAQEVRAQAGTR